MNSNILLICARTRAAAARSSFSPIIRVIADGYLSHSLHDLSTPLIFLPPHPFYSFDHLLLSRSNTLVLCLHRYRCSSCSFFKLLYSFLPIFLAYFIPIALLHLSSLSLTPVSVSRFLVFIRLHRTFFFFLPGLLSYVGKRALRLAAWLLLDVRAFESKSLCILYYVIHFRWCLVTSVLVG